VVNSPYEVEFRSEAMSDLDHLSSDIRTVHLIGHRREVYR
jgi:hypothetical protein